MNSPPLSDVMLGLNADVLKALAKRLGLPKTLTRKADMAHELCGLVKERPAEYVAALSEVERNFLAEAAHGGGWVDPSAFSAKYGTPCFRPEKWINARKAYPLQLLLHGNEGLVGIPNEVTGRFRKLLPKPVPLTVETVDEVPAVHIPGACGWHDSGDERPVRIHEGEKIAFQELRRILGLVQAGKLRVADKSKRPTDVSARVISKVLIIPDFDLEPPEDDADFHGERGGAVRAHAWGVVVQQCGWARPRGGKLTLTKEGKGILGSATPDAFRAGIEKLMGDGGFDEFNRINHIRGQSGKAKRHMTDPSGRKAAIGASMRKWPPNAWVTFDAAFRFTFASGNVFDVCPHAWHLYFDSPFYGNLDGWQKEMSRQYLRAFLFETLATLGLVDVAYAYPHALWPEMGRCDGSDQYSFCGRYDGLLYVRLNELGAYCLGSKKIYTAPAPEALFKLLPNLEIAAVAADISPAEASMLDLYATQKAERVWRLDRGRILNHLESGGTMKEVTQFLEAQADGDMPATVSGFLADIGLKASAVRGIEDAVIVQFGDATTAALVAHDSAARKLCVRAGEQGVAVPKRRERAFRAALKKLGFVIPHGE